MKPLPAAVENGPATTTTCGELTVTQLLTALKEVYTSLKREVGLFIIHQFLSQSQDGATILLKTGGQPSELVKRTRARKTTDEVTRKTARQRPKVVGETRIALSSGAAGTQLKDELRAMGRLEREELPKEALRKEFKITIPRGDILAMKADLGKTWYKVRTLRRWFEQ